VDIDAYIEARNALIDKDLIAFDGTIFQVLSLPDKPRLNNPVILKAQEDMERSDPATMRQILRNAFGNNHDR